MFGQRQSRSRTNDSHVLPTPAQDRHDRRARRSCFRWPHNRRYTRFALLGLVFFSGFALFRAASYQEDEEYVILDDPPEDHPFPPLYQQYHEAELALPQHQQDGRSGKYVYMANHVHASGWGNEMQEVLFNSYLAYKAGRHFVLYNYTWNRDGPDYTDYNGKLIPSRIPHSAMIRGPTVGDPFPEGANASLAVAKEYYDTYCPNPTVMNSDVVSRTISSEASAKTVLQAWVAKLHEMDDDSCVEIERDTQQIFSIWIFGSRRVLDIFPEFAESPIMTGFRWAPLVVSAFAANRPVFAPPSFFETHLPSVIYHLGTSTTYPMISGLLVLHVRRGDFVDHCEHLARWSSRYNGFNSFPELPDQFEPPQNANWGEATPENRETYMRHCFPSIEQIVRKVDDVRQTKAGRGLRSVYVMTNGPKDFVDKLKVALLGMGGFERVTSSRDLWLSWEQKYVAQAVDMLIGQRAQILIGNGFSSLTSNIVMMRMANGFDPASNRLWS